MAPEVILQAYDYKCDVWSTGMMLFQLLTGRFYHWTNLKDIKLKDIWRTILTVRVDLETPYWQSKLSPGARSFLKKLLTRDPKDRISAAEVRLLPLSIFTFSKALNHPWVQEGGTAKEMILEGSVVQRLQRFATYGDLKQLILMKVSEEILLPGSKRPILLSLKVLQIPKLLCWKSSAICLKF